MNRVVEQYLKQLRHPGVLKNFKCVTIRLYTRIYAQVLN